MLHLIFYSRANKYFPICSIGSAVVFIFILHISSMSGYVMSIFRFLLDKIMHCALLVHYGNV